MSEALDLSCEEALRLLTTFLDGELDAGNEEDVHRHLERCRSCYSRAEFEKRLKQRLRELGRETVPPPFESRIRALISSFESWPAAGQNQ